MGDRSPAPCCRPQPRRWMRPSPNTISTTYPVPWSSPTRRTGATTPRTPTGVAARPLGLGRTAVRRRSTVRADHDRRHLRLRVRAAPGKLPPTPSGVSRGLLLHWLQRRIRDGGLASEHHRDQGILSYEFMIANRPERSVLVVGELVCSRRLTPWLGQHPATGQGSSPHAWGMAQANKVLLDSLVAQRSDGALIVGRGVPSEWLRGIGRSRSRTSPPPTAGG